MPLATPTPTEVRAVISLPTSVVDATISSFIADAVLVVDRCPGVASLSAALQTAIVKYVTAHLLSQVHGSSGSLSQESLGDAARSYAVATPTSPMGLGSSPFGRQALLLDSTGCLSKLGRSRVIFQKVDR